MRKQLGLFLMLCSMCSMATPLDKVVAVVNSDVITLSELNEQVEIAKQQLLARKMEFPSESALRKQVLNHLIDEQIQLQLAKNDRTRFSFNQKYYYQIFCMFTRSWYLIDQIDTFMLSFFFEFHSKNLVIIKFL